MLTGGLWFVDHNHVYALKYVTGFERTHLPHTQQQDILFTITR